jgi:hypothetical protein
VERPDKLNLADALLTAAGLHDQPPTQNDRMPISKLEDRLLIRCWFDGGTVYIHADGYFRID